MSRFPFLLNLSQHTWRNGPLASIATVLGCLLWNVTAANPTILKYDWKPPLTFTAVDSATFEVVNNGTGRTNNMDSKLFMKFRAGTGQTNVLSWARVDVLRIDEFRRGEPGFNQTAAPVTRILNSTPSLLIAPTGEAVGLEDSSTMFTAIATVRDSLNPERDGKVDERFVAAISTHEGKQLLLQTMSKVWDYWVTAWDWDQQVEEIRELLEEQKPRVVRMESLLPLVDDGDAVPTELEFGFLGVETNGQVRLSFRSSLPLSKENGQAMGQLINSVALEEAKMSPEEINKLELGITVALEAVIHPKTLIPSWVRAIETVETKNDVGEISVKKETHDYRFNFAPSDEELRPSLVAGRRILSKAQSDQAARARKANLIVGVVLIGGTVLVSVSMIWIMRVAKRRWKRGSDT